MSERENQHSLLGIRLFEQRTPKLVFGRRVRENEFAITCWQQVIHNHFNPIAKLPEPELVNAGIFVLVVSLLLLDVRNDAIPVGLVRRQCRRGGNKPAVAQLSLQHVV